MAHDTLQHSALSQAISDLYADLSDFVQKELRLARAELSHNINVRLYGGMWMAAAGFLAVLAVLLIVEAIVFAIVSAGLAPYWSCLVVAGGLAILAAISFFYGRSSVASEDLAPTRSARQLSEAVSTAKEQLR